MCEKETNSLEADCAKTDGSSVAWIPTGNALVGRHHKKSYFEPFIHLFVWFESAFAPGLCPRLEKNLSVYTF